MSVWSDLQDRSSGEVKRKEDIHKATLLIKKVGNAEKLSGFYTRADILFKLNHDQQQFLRWHNCDLVLDDERFKRRALYRLGVLTTLGDTGETIIQDAIDKVEKEYGYFDGYTCDEEKTAMHKYVSEKTKKMIDEIRDILDRHGMVLLGWKNLIRYRRAVSAELIQDLYYDSDDPNGKGIRVLRPYGTIKEKEIGLYKITYNWVRKKNNEEIVCVESTDKRFYAPIGSDVIATWQKVNDEHVRVNGDWSFFLRPKGTPSGEADIVYSHKDQDLQEDNFLKIKLDYYNTLCQKYGCKIGEIEDDKLSVEYWDSFTRYLNQKDIDTLKNEGKVLNYLYRFDVGIEDFNYYCRINPGHKNPTNSIAVFIKTVDVHPNKNLVRFHFIEGKCKTQIESLQCDEVEWRRGEYKSYIEINLRTDFRDKSAWNRQFEWMYNTLMELHKIVKPYYEAIKSWWEKRIISLKAISAELEQEIYYNSNDSKASFRGKDEDGFPQYLTSGKYKEKSIGLYKVTYERTYKTDAGETVTKANHDTHFFAIKESDVVDTWQRLNDKSVQMNGDWICYYHFDNSIKKGVYETDETQWEHYKEIKKAYRKKLFQDYGCKVECCQKEEPTKEPISTTITQPHMGQVLIIFENVLNGDVLLESKEIQALCNHQFGECNLIVGDTDLAEELHDWLDKEMHKAINGGYDQLYRMKAPFADIQGEDNSGEYSGPVSVHLFEPDAAIDDGILLFSCNWEGSIFSNNLYVIGVIIGGGDLDRIISSKIKREVPEENLKAAGVPSKQEIERIIGSGARYTVQADGTIDVEWAAFGELRIEKKDCKDGRLPLRFGKVDVNFNCSDCGLTTLEGAPKYVREDFKCNNNKLTSLEGGPEVVKESYYCQDNQLTSLKGAPKKVGYVSEDTYTSFDTGESWVTGYSSYCVFDCQNNKITSLEGVDMHLMGTLKCAGNCISKKKKFNVIVEYGTVRWGKQNLE